MLTKNGVCYNLALSPYRFESKDVTYYFSSKSHLEKFLEERGKFFEATAESLYRRFRIHFCSSDFTDLVLYKKIESRGFFVRVKGDKVTCLDNLQLSGQIRKYNVSEQT